MNANLRRNESFRCISFHTQYFSFNFCFYDYYIIQTLLMSFSLYPMVSSGLTRSQWCEADSDAPELTLNWSARRSRVHPCCCCNVYGRWLVWRVGGRSWPPCTSRLASTARSECNEQCSNDRLRESGGGEEARRSQDRGQGDENR